MHILYDHLDDLMCHFELNGQNPRWMLTVMATKKKQTKKTQKKMF